jgi:uncharacterized phage protein (TIGR01671 family)
MNNQELMSKKIIKFKLWDKTESKMYGSVGLTPEGIPFKRFYPYEQQWHDNYELIQFTGLTDKNGEEIYNGDILRWRCSAGNTIKKGVVRFDEGTLTYWCKDQTLANLFYTQTNEHYLALIALNRFTYDCPVVIGNKFLTALPKELKAIIGEALEQEAKQ